MQLLIIGLLHYYRDSYWTLKQHLPKIEACSDLILDTHLQCWSTFILSN